MAWLIVWAALSGGVFLGFVLTALFRANGPDAPSATVAALSPAQAALIRANGPDAPSATVAALSPAQAARMGTALYHAGEMLQSGDFEYVSGGFIVQDLGHGVVNFKGDLLLRAVEDE